jgi:MOSC domain-containing protein YiiM
METGGKLVGIWLKPAHGVAMRAVEQAEAEAGAGLVGSADRGGDRQVTLLDHAAWKRATAELGEEVDPAQRRANLLVEGLALEATPGRQLRVGPCLCEITEETEPCHLMDAVREGLRVALQPEARGGVCVRVITGGTLRLGDPVRWT